MERLFGWRAGSARPVVCEMSLFRNFDRAKLRVGRGFGLRQSVEGWSDHEV